MLFASEWFYRQGDLLSPDESKSSEAGLRGAPLMLGCRTPLGVQPFDPKTHAALYCHGLSQRLCQVNHLLVSVVRVEMEPSIIKPWQARQSKGRSASSSTKTRWGADCSRSDAKRSWMKAERQEGPGLLGQQASHQLPAFLLWRPFLRCLPKRTSEKLLPSISKHSSTVFSRLQDLDFPDCKTFPHSIRKFRQS